MRVLRGRPQLLWLLVPFVLYLGALPLADRIRPAPAGVPFLFCWLFFATLATTPAVWLAFRGDRRRAASTARKSGAVDGEGTGGQSAQGGPGAQGGSGRRGAAGGREEGA